MNVIQSNKPNKVLYSWCTDIEETALNQAKLLVEQPFVFKHMSLMPDAHPGITMPIGGVLATKNVIIPACVGVDIGCGMCAMKTSLKISNFNEDKKAEILHSIGRSIPVGFSHNTDYRRKEIEGKYEDKLIYFLEKYSTLYNCETKIFQNIEQVVLEQIATLGGGNHFIEIQYDESENIWIMLHSGSRNIGKKICDTFNDLAKDLNQKYYSQVPETIPFLPTNSTEGKEYLQYMDFALQFAFYNRQFMMDFIKKDLGFAFKDIKIQYNDMINIHHNYASLENHFGENVWIHRKGATLATDYTIGIIPGSCGTNSYIVKGLNNKDSYNSCSHGAGRKMGRKDFNRQYNTPDKIKEIEDSLKNVVHTKFTKEHSFKKNKETGLLDVSEAPQAYKNIEDVMNNQKDLVVIFKTLKPLISMKG
jgi:tRNA-splicing ligase RtcB